MSVPFLTVSVPLVLLAIWVAFGLGAVIAVTALADLGLRRLEAVPPRRASIPARPEERH